MNTNIKYLSALLLLLLIGFVTACEKENIDSMEPGMEEEFPVDTLFCDLEFELFFFSGGIPVEIIMIDSLTGGTAPFYYSWNTGDTTETLTVTTPGIYTLTVTDANGCTFTQSIEATLNTSPCDSIELEIVAFDTFPPGTMRLEPILSGGATPPYTYEWSNGDSTMYTAVSVNGTYGLTVTDANGCVWTAEITVTIADPCDSFVVTFLPPVDTTGMMLLFVDIDFGTPPFTYQWQDGSTNNPPFEATVIPGTYSVTVTDVNYCTAEDSIDLQ